MLAAIQVVDKDKDIGSLDEELHLSGKILVVDNTVYFLLDASLLIGIMTRQLLSELEEDGDISYNQAKMFYSGVRQFYLTAATYAINNLPINDPLLINAEFVYFQKELTLLFL